GTSAERGMDRASLDATLSALGNRVFLMHNVHEDGPVTFETRWVLSYLRGPLTRTQIRQLMSGRGVDASGLAAAAQPVAAAPTPGAAPPVPPPPPPAGPAVGPAREADGALAAAPPILPPGIRQHFLPHSRPDGPVPFVPAIYGAASVHIRDARRGVDERLAVQRLVGIPDHPGPLPWDEGEDTDVAPSALLSAPPAGARFAPLPAAASQVKQYDAWAREFAEWLRASQAITLLVHAGTK